MCEITKIAVYRLLLVCLCKNTMKIPSVYRSLLRARRTKALSLHPHSADWGQMVPELMLSQINRALHVLTLSPPLSHTHTHTHKYTHIAERNGRKGRCSCSVSLTWECVCVCLWFIVSAFYWVCMQSTNVAPPPPSSSLLEVKGPISGECC